MATTFRLRLISPTGVLFEGNIESLVAPGTEGYLGVLAHHAPLVTGLRPGTVTFRTADGKTTERRLTGGLLEVSNNQAVILADDVLSNSDASG